MLGFTRIVSVVVASSLFSVLVACGARDGETEVRVAMIGNPGGPFETGARLSPAGQIVRAATSDGLVGFDEQGRVIPAMAERWIVTDDGLSYIFRLRDGTWPDKSPMTSASVASALQQSLAALAGTGLAADIGRIDSIVARTGRVLEVRLERPNPEFLQLLAQPEMTFLARGRGNDNGRSRGTGAMRLTRDGNAALLTPVPPESRGLPSVRDWNERARTVRLQAMPAEKAIAAFKERQADMVLGGTMADFPLARTIGIARGTVALDPVQGLLGLIFSNDAGFLSSPGNREAIAMTIDREAFAADLDATGWLPTTRVGPSGLEGDSGAVGERWAGRPVQDRIAEARVRVDRWRESGEPVPKLRIALPPGPGADLLFDRLASDLGAIGVAVQRVPQNDEADLRLIDVVARYPRPHWFLDQLRCAARRGLCSPLADSLAERARQSEDPAERATLLAQAEAELTLENAYVPLGAPLRWSVLRRRMTGFAPNRLAVHPLLPIAMLPR
ncbi:MAG: ABC transporter substrate-binding protein [Thiohalobacteraceae bacterium]